MKLHSDNLPLHFPVFVGPASLSPCSYFKHSPALCHSHSLSLFPSLPSFFSNRIFNIGVLLLRCKNIHLHGQVVLCCNITSAFNRTESPNRVRELQLLSLKRCNSIINILNSLSSFEDFLAKLNFNTHYETC